MKWHNVTTLMRYHRIRIDALKGDTSPEAMTKREGHERKIRGLSAIQKRLPSRDPLDPIYRRLFYVRYAVRYADDFLIGIIGSKQEAATLFREIKTFLNIYLKLEISEEKSGIHHA